MAVTYYVALPFMRTDDGTAPGEAQECQSEGSAIRWGRRNVTGSCQGRGGRIQACRRSERCLIFGRGRIEKVRRCAGRFERAVTMVLLLRHDRDGRGWICRCRRLILCSSTSSARRSRRVLPQCSDSVAIGAIADVADAHLKRRFLIQRRGGQPVHFAQSAGLGGLSWKGMRLYSSFCERRNAI
jgi:hypothetical protein